MEDTRYILIALGRLECKVESLITMQQHHNEELGRMDKRLRLLEQGKAAILGVAAVVGSITAATVSWVLRNT